MKILLLFVFFICLTFNYTIAEEPKILFYCNDSIYITDQNYKILRTIEHKSNAKISPDYKNIFFTSTENWNTTFCIYDIISENIIKSRMFEDKNVFENPTWSTSSDKIMYITIDRDLSGDVGKFIEGYDFNKRELFRINLSHLPQFQINLCSWYSITNDILCCDDNVLYIINDKGSIKKTIDFLDIFSKHSKNIEPTRKSEDTLSFLSNISFIIPPFIRDVIFIKNMNLYLFTARSFPSESRYYIGGRALYSFDNMEGKLTRLTPDSITVDNFQILSNNKVIINGFSLRDISVMSEDSSRYHLTKFGKKYHYNIKYNIFEMDINDKTLRLIKENALLIENERSLGLL